VNAGIINNLGIKWHYYIPQDQDIFLPIDRLESTAKQFGKSLQCLLKLLVTSKN